MNILNIVDENGEIIGEESRENIHKNGLLHKEIHVWFYTPMEEIIFQLRSKDKDTFPNLLDATVGGHVELGSDYVDTALKEMEEETGIKTDANNLKLIKKLHKQAFDSVTGLINNALRAYFAYLYEGDIADLRVEEGEAERFEARKIEKLIKGVSENDQKRFIPSLLESEYIELYKEIKEILST